ncbi:hypothetical protein M9458_032461, partial [Cirrhinus mrigala]
MEFDLLKFSLSPTLDEFDRCRKKDLVVIAEFYNITVPKEQKKQVIKDELYGKLVEAGVLPGRAVVEGPEVETDGGAVSDDADSVSGKMKADPMVTVRLKELDLELKKQEYETQLLRLKELELKTDRDVKLRKLDIEAQMLRSKPIPPPRTRPPSSSSEVGQPDFDVGKYVKLVPPFRETEVDSYFVAFERVAAKLKWPRDMWALLLQCNLVGKAQEVCAALPIEDSLNYDIVKLAVLRAYELVPEAYRQKFRACSKTAKQTFVEFAREKKALFEKWCLSTKIATLEDLQELILLEDFKNCLPESIVVHLNEQKVSKLSDAAVLADEFVLTHKTVFSPVRVPKVFSTIDVGKNKGNGSFRPANELKDTSKRPERKRVCFYCLDPGHMISNCKAWQQKAGGKPKGVALTSLTPRSNPSAFDSFLQTCTVALPDGSDFRPIVMLRDTGSAQSIILESTLPFSSKSYTGNNVLIRGIEMGCTSVPLHTIHLKSDLISGPVSIGVHSQLPVEGVDMILGNDLAGPKVFPYPIVSAKPDASGQDDALSQFASIFPSCAVTRAQKRKFDDVIDLSRSFLVSSPETAECKFFVQLQPSEGHECLKGNDAPLKVSREQLIAAQKSDLSLSKCISAAADKTQISDAPVGYCWDGGVLMRWWKPSDSEREGAYQIVLPTGYRTQIMKLAHEHICSGHLGVTKTHDRIARHFFWPSMKSSVSAFVRSCYICQLAGKPNQVIPQAPLQPIPVIGEPFERLILDCVGPLPKAKSGHQYMLTIMCTATRYPEAVPLRSITTKAVVKELVKFCSMFGLPKVIQTDRGTNFTSNLFEQLAKELQIQHELSSANHPESQGALERFHQTLKSMLRTYCVETGKDWVDGLPLLMLAVRSTVQESLGFSPAELVFGHTIRGPLELIHDQFLSKDSPRVPILEYVSTFREHLHRAWDVAKQHLSDTQVKMKTRYDKKSVARSFQPGESVLVLLPVPSSPMHARFAGPYTIEKKLSDTNYIILTPDRRRKSRVCHVNMLKAYVDRNKCDINPVAKSVTAVNIVDLPTGYVPEVDDLSDKDAHATCGRLSNSTILATLPTYLSYLSEEHRNDVVKLINKYPTLFHDIPSQTNVLVHDIDVGQSTPIKQHAYRVNPCKRQVMRDEVEYLVRNGFAVASQSPWSSPCILVPKSDGSLRFCTDFRKVNSITKADSFPLPRVEDCVDRVGSSRYVTKLDLLKGYWQVPLTPRASEISAFVTPDAFMQYTVMAFGMRNAPATFQRLMQTVLSEIQNCEVYLDDVVVYSMSWEDHLSTLNSVLKRLAEASLTLNLSKCEFAKAVVTYLGKLVGQGQVKPVSAKVEAIAEFPSPTNKRELRRFLGMTGYYRGFCKNFASVVAPLTDLLSTERKFVWDKKCESAFCSAKDLLCNAPILSAPNFDLPFTLQVDASARGAGAVLMQADDAGIEHPVSYFSKKFIKCQQNYSTIEKEALALLLALKHFEVYLSTGNRIVVYTDHNPLTFLSRMSNSNQRLMRWALIVQEFDLDIRYKKGAENIVADALSRAYT